MDGLESWFLSVPGQTHDIEVHSLLPASGLTAKLPIVLWLHGAGSSADSLDLHVDGIRQRWDSGVAPPAVLSCASTPTGGGFYSNTPSGPWETVVSETLRIATGVRYRADADRVALFGASMGGYGALKILFASPRSYLGAVAISPAIFPGESSDEVSRPHRESILGDLFRLLERNPREGVSSRLRENADAIRSAGRALFLGVGDRDEFAR